jgi:hypothetical protein
VITQADVSLELTATDNVVHSILYGHITKRTTSEGRSSICASAGVTAKTADETQRDSHSPVLAL